MKVFEDTTNPGQYIREDGQPGFACARCDNGYATEQARDLHECEAVSLDLDTFTDTKGLFEQGYTPEDIAALSADVRSVQFLFVWDYFDDDGFGGESDIVARQVNPDGTTGPWMRLNPLFEDWLLNADSTTNLDDVDALVSEEEFDEQDFMVLVGDETGATNAARTQRRF